MTAFARPRLAVALAVVAALALAGCASSAATTGASVPAISVPTVSLAPTGSAREVAFTTMLTSKDKRVAVVGPDDQIAYGWNDLFGTTTFEGKPATVELKAGIWYVNGAGPFSGFITITLEDGASLAMNMVGEASVDPTTKATSFAAGLTVIGGTGPYTNSSGAGSWTGSREGAIGGAVKFDGTISLTS